MGQGCVREGWKWNSRAHKSRCIAGMGTSDRSLWWQEGIEHTEQAVLFSWGNPTSSSYRDPQASDSSKSHSACTGKLSCQPGRRFTTPVNASDSTSLTSDFNPCLCSQADVLRCDRQVITHNIQYSKFQLIGFKSNLVLQMTGSAALQKAAESLLSPDYFKDREV